MLLALATLPFLTAAQPPSATLAPPLIEQRDQSPALPDANTPPRTSPDAAIAVDAENNAVAIRGIDFVGVEAPEPVAQAARQYLGRPASRQTLDALAKSIAQAYAQSDIALYTVAIPQQDLSGGQVKVLLAEGFVEDIVYPNGASPLIRAYAEHMRAERPLTRRALERYLSLMRDIPGAKVDVALLRGTKPGGVRLSITPQRKPFDFSFGIDNRTQSGLGSGQLRASAQANSLLRDGDRTDLVLLSAIDFKRYQYAGLSHQTPLGSDGLTLGLSASWLKTRLKNFPVKGEAKTLGASVSYPVIRGYKRNLTISAGLDGLNSDAAFLGAVLSSDHIRTARAAIGYSMIGDKSVLSAGMTVARGLDILNARGTPGFTDTVFTKLTARAGYDRMLGKQFVGRLRVTGQYSADRLSGSERLPIGGPEYGRAFDTALLSGDKGAAGSLELAYRPTLPPKFKGSEIYGFIDGASVHVKERRNFAGAEYSLASAGGGVRLSYNSQASLTVEGARVIKEPYDEIGGWRLNIGWQIKMRR
ncbi:ShlB/FhaC/HecB family hemolysin secretion/activation protein [Sphingobium bisphenolivorans]|uniref:ShlB/FhaC/HecB family hemolysin secretion/activation protein n=1 Tax=Sphingobium bisphenolivorans TaxID=1335760 RepID=UPI00039AF986|nr:ShlB/FhaC/HecB family hemolysin secretion/activation protein [Sphingobium bisphenolivorans]